MSALSLQQLIESLGPDGFYHRLCTLLNEKQLRVDDVRYGELAEACGVLPQLRRLKDWIPPQTPITAWLHESHSGVHTALFQVVTAELIGRKVLEGYEDDSGFIGDRLVSVLPSQGRNLKLAGFRALSGPSEVPEGHPYEEATFGEKFITTQESKQGRILSINEELIAFDQTGEINRRAMALGYYLRQERERTIIRAVSDADAGQGHFVYRPAGQGRPLYPTDGSHRNWIGPGNTTSPDFAQPIPLTDGNSLDRVRSYRAVEVLDDRIDGPPRPIVTPLRQLLVPERLLSRARSIVHATEIGWQEQGRSVRLANPWRGELEVLSSPFLDEQGGSALHDWYLGDFKRQFVWTEIWPVQTFLQRSDSEAAFERDVVLRVKVRYYGGISAVDTRYVTKVAGQTA
ncbi:MAG: hypothetical protein KatS3mg114_1454 [Planctomycetaceae bacterium]|nr:MAG: hypothetical protein KatS3mg114_1454 [Planctomycetaceae bacterium]